MKLHKLEVLKRQARAQDHAAAIAGAGVRRGCCVISATVTAGRQHDRVAAEAVDAAILHAQRDHAPANAALHDEIEREILHEEIRIIAQALLIQRVQDGVAGAVGGGGGALNRRAFAHILHMATKGALINGSVGVARKGHPGMFKFINSGGGFAHHILNCILIAEPVTALDGIEHMPCPMIRRIVAKARRNTTLSSDSMAACWEDFGDTGGLETRLCAAHRGAQARSARADDDRVIGVINDLVACAVRVWHQTGAPVNAILKME